MNVRTALSRQKWFRITVMTHQPPPNIPLVGDGCSTGCTDVGTIKTGKDLRDHQIYSVQFTDEELEVQGAK